MDFLLCTTVAADGYQKVRLRTHDHNTPTLTTYTLSCGHTIGQTLAPGVAPPTGFYHSNGRDKKGNRND